MLFTFNRANSNKFDLVSKMKPTGDQPQAIKKLTDGLKKGVKNQILLGATGTGKTFTIANVIAHANKPTLILAHNKTLAGQDYEAMKKFFPHNPVGYFVSYYDYYQPEAYVPSTDTYIEKDASINDEIDKLRHYATTALLERNDVIIVASVSSIFGLGSPQNYFNHIISLKVGQRMERDTLLHKLVDDQFERNDLDFQRDRFRVRGDIVDVFPSSNNKTAYRIEFFGDEIDSIKAINAIDGSVVKKLPSVAIFPATHFLTASSQVDSALKGIHHEMVQQVHKFVKQGKLIEAQRIKQRTTYDIEMIREMGYTNGIENYSRWLDGRKPGEPPYTLLDFFPKDFLIVADESHQTIPQIGGMRNGDKARKKSLIQYGFRLPSALDNRPLTMGEFEQHIHQIIYMSATPGSFEVQHTRPENIAQQVIRPTGLLDPKINVRPTINQMDDLVGEINKRAKKHQRVFVTTLTKRMSEDLTHYLKNLGIRVRYLHSGIRTLQRTKLLHDLRVGKFDVLVGINLLREGIDVPEVSLVAILDADKEGFLRNTRSLVQTAGRAARNNNGEVIMYGDVMTESMAETINETNRRRSVQLQFNKKHHITPTTIKKPIAPLIMSKSQKKHHKKATLTDKGLIKDFDSLNKKNQKQTIRNLKHEMKLASKKMDFERAADLRDTIIELSSHKRRVNRKKNKNK